MSKINRRDFLKLTAGTVLASLLPKALRAEPPAVGPVIAVASGTSDNLVKAAVDALGGISRFVKAGDRVLVKPNISFAANAEYGTTTNVAVVRQVVRLCLEAGAERITILDYPLQNADLCVAQSGIREAIVDAGRVSLLILGKERQFTEIAVPRGAEIKSVQIAGELQRCNRLINVPVAKSHSTTGVSLGLKNLMGLIWDRNIFHQVNIHQAIADLATVIQPGLTVLDATRVLVSGGPGGPGKTVILNKVIAGTDAVAVDSYGVTITPWYNKAFTGRGVKHIIAAARHGLGEIDTVRMTIKEVEA